MNLFTLLAPSISLILLMEFELKEYKKLQSLIFLLPSFITSTLIVLVLMKVLSGVMAGPTAIITDIILTIYLMYKKHQIKSQNDEKRNILDKIKDILKTGD